MSRNFESSMSMANVQNVPDTPPLNKFGGAFENGWEYFFEDLNTHLQQMQSVYKLDTHDLYVNRNGSLVTVSGVFEKASANIGVKPVSEMFFYNGIIKLTANGDVFVNIGHTEDSVATSITFIAR